MAAGGLYGSIPVVIIVRLCYSWNDLLFVDAYGEPIETLG